MNEAQHSETGRCEGSGSDGESPGTPKHLQTSLERQQVLGQSSMIEWEMNKKKNTLYIRIFLTTMDICGFRIGDK